MAVPAIKSTLRDEILRILQQDIVYQVQDGDVGQPIKPTSVAYRKTRVQVSRPFELKNQNTDMPGLVVSESLMTGLRQTGGTNERDVWPYEWLIQLIDQDLFDNVGRIATWDKWIEQIMSVFQFSQMNGVVVPPTGQVKCATAIEVKDIDEKKWVREGNFIAGIQLTIEMLQPRGKII